MVWTTLKSRGLALLFFSLSLSLLPSPSLSLSSVLTFSLLPALSLPLQLPDGDPVLRPQTFTYPPVGHSTPTTYTSISPSVTTLSNLRSLLQTSANSYFFPPKISTTAVYPQISPSVVTETSAVSSPKTSPRIRTKLSRRRSQGFVKPSLIGSRKRRPHKHHPKPRPLLRFLKSSSQRTFSKTNAWNRLRNSFSHPARHRKRLASSSPPPQTSLVAPSLETSVAPSFETSTAPSKGLLPRAPPKLLERPRKFIKLIGVNLLALLSSASPSSHHLPSSPAPTTSTLPPPSTTSPSPPPTTSPSLPPTTSPSPPTTTSPSPPPTTSPLPPLTTSTPPPTTTSPPPPPTTTSSPLPPTTTSPPPPPTTTSPPPPSTTTSPQTPPTTTSPPPPPTTTSTSPPPTTTSPPTPPPTTSPPPPPPTTAQATTSFPPPPTSLLPKSVSRRPPKSRKRPKEIPRKRLPLAPRAPSTPASSTTSTFSPSPLSTSTSSSPPPQTPPPETSPPRPPRPPRRPLPQTSHPLFERLPFIVTWNIPDLVCNRYNISLDTSPFKGVATPAKVPGQFLSLFYTDRLGLYPYVDLATMNQLYGGIPQRAKLKASMAKARNDINYYIPSRTSRGLAVIDWEEWRPLWDRNWGTKRIYQMLSVSHALGRDRTLTAMQALKLAKRQFQAAAKSFMSGTLALGKSLRPNYLWGFYLFPNCYNYGWMEPGYTGRCSKEVKGQNDKLLWLWEASSALYPSVYLQESLGDSRRAALMVRHRVQEAMRVAALPERTGTAPVFVYTRPVFIDRNRRFLSQEDLVSTIGESAAVGASGAVMWGASADYDDKASCEALSGYLSSTLNPYIANVTTAAQLCSDFLCQENGRCVRKHYNSDHYLHLSPGSFRIERVQGRHLAVGRPTFADLKVFSKKFTCQCYVGLNCTPRKYREMVKALMLRVKQGLYKKVKTLKKTSLDHMEQSSIAKENGKHALKV